MQQHDIGIIPKDVSKISLEQRTESHIWVAMLEQELFQSSNMKMLFSDFQECQDPLSVIRDDFVRVYLIDDFDALQTNFLMSEVDKRLEMWKRGSVEEKFRLWETLDFEHLFNISNSLSKHKELLDDYLGYYRMLMKEVNDYRAETEARGKKKKPLETWGIKQPKREKREPEGEKQAPPPLNKLKRSSLLLSKRKTLLKSHLFDVETKKKPVLDFTKIFESPEFKTQNFSQASNF